MGIRSSQDDLNVQFRLRTTLLEAIVTQPNPETDVEGSTQVAEKLPTTVWVPRVWRQSHML